MSKQNQYYETPFVGMMFKRVSSFFTQHCAISSPYFTIEHDKQPLICSALAKWNLIHFKC